MGSFESFYFRPGFSREVLPTIGVVEHDVAALGRHLESLVTGLEGLEQSLSNSQAVRDNIEHYSDYMNAIEEVIKENQEGLATLNDIIQGKHITFTEQESHVFEKRLDALKQILTESEGLLNKCRQSLQKIEAILQKAVLQLEG